MQPAFIPVPESVLPNGLTVPAFRVAQYHCGRNADGQAIVSPDVAPWVGINYHAARQACTAIGAALLTETQALAIAHNLAAQPANWTGGAVGEGVLRQGLRNGTVDDPQPASLEPGDPDESRWFTLFTGERICDFSGNVFSWIFDDIQGNADGITDRAFAEDSPSLQAPFARMTKGMGWRPSAGTNWSGRALLRGGCWYSESDAGVFRLDLGWPGSAFGGVGFRCTLPGL